VASVLLLAAIAARETTWWRSSETIWAHAAGATSDNLMAHHYLACLYARDGKIDEAIAEEQQALACDSIDRYWISEAHLALADCLTAEEKPGEALPHYEEAIRISPGYALCHSQLAVALASAGQLDRAIVEFRETVRLASDSLAARMNLANVLLAKGETGEAAELCREVLKKDPTSEQARTILNLALAAEGKSLGPSPARGGSPKGGQR
jgi:tetratricopeptide (TPR) repeat protein